MDNFLICFNAIAPLLLLILLGYTLKRLGFIQPSGFAAMDRLCFKILIPAMLFCNVYFSDFPGQFQGNAILLMDLAVLATFLVAFFWFPGFFPGKRKTSPPSSTVCATETWPFWECP